jgi:MFS family permease
VQLVIAGFAESIALVIAVFTVAGFANAWAQPASNVLITRVVPPARLGVALGLQKSAIPAAALLGGLAVPAIALTVGWRWAFVAGAAFAVASAVHVPAPRRTATAATTRRREGRPDVPTRHLAVLAAGVGFGSAASNALSAFLVVSGVRAGLSEGLAGMLLTLGSLAGVGVRLLVGARADKRPGRTLPAMVTMFVLASGAFVLLSTEVELLYLVGTPIAFATAYAWPGLFQLAVVRSNPSAPGTATGIAMTGTLSGAVAGPVVFGLVASTGNYTAAFGAGFLLAAATIVYVASGLITEPSAPPAPAFTTSSPDLTLSGGI